jgi:predicted metal-binding membrane protein
MIGLESVLRHERALACVGIAALVTLAWYYVWQGAGMGMSALDMTALSLFPHRQEGMEGSMEAGWAVVIAMWWVMMIAMMTPSATPLVLLYLRVLRSRLPEGGSAGLLPAMLLAGYLAVWLVFSVAAAGLQKVLEPSGLISEMMLWSRSALLSALVLGAAGLYQFTALKRACLTQCRTPVRFLMENWRPGHAGSFLLGARHGIYCLGCCWMLMALLFVGGIMNLVWIAALMVFVLVEKLLPGGPAFGKVSGVVLIVWAVATLLV